MFSKALRALLVASALCACASGVSAQVVAESGEAGETLATAQVINGGFSQITGTLSNLGSDDLPIDDIDMFRINIVDTAAFSVTSVTNLIHHPPIIDGVDDTMLYLFDADGVQVLHNDDPIGPGLDPIFLPGQLASFAPGVYYLAFDQFPTRSIPANGGILSGWDRSLTYFPQYGSYTLTFTGTGGGMPGVDDGGPPRGAVPEPATWALMILGFGAAGAVLRPRRAVAPA